MTLKQYLAQCELPQAWLATQLGVSEMHASRLVNGKQVITAERAVQIEEITRGVVSRHDLRPDLWPNAPRRKHKPTEAA